MLSLLLWGFLLLWLLLLLLLLLLCRFVLWLRTMLTLRATGWRSECWPRGLLPRHAPQFRFRKSAPFVIDHHSRPLAHVRHGRKGLRLCWRLSVLLALQGMPKLVITVRSACVPSPCGRAGCCRFAVLDLAPRASPSPASSGVHPPCGLAVCASPDRVVCLLSLLLGWLLRCWARC